MLRIAALTAAVLLCACDLGGSATDRGVTPGLPFDVNVSRAAAAPFCKGASPRA